MVTYMILMCLFRWDQDESLLITPPAFDVLNSLRVTEVWSLLKMGPVEMTLLWELYRLSPHGLGHSEGQRPQRVHIFGPAGQSGLLLCCRKVCIDHGLESILRILPAKCPCAFLLGDEG